MPPNVQLSAKVNRHLEGPADIALLVASWKNVDQLLARAVCDSKIVIILEPEAMNAQEAAPFSGYREPILLPSSLDPSIEADDPHVRNSFLGNSMPDAPSLEGSCSQNLMPDETSLEPPFPESSTAGDTFFGRSFPESPMADKTSLDDSKSDDNAHPCENRPSTPVLGPGAGLWNPHIQANIQILPYQHRGKIPFLIITQGCTFAEQALALAQKRLLNVVGAINVGAFHSNSIVRLIQESQTLEQPPYVLLILNQSFDAKFHAQIAPFNSRLLIVLSRPDRAVKGLPLPQPDQQHTLALEQQALKTNINIVDPSKLDLLITDQNKSELRPPTEEMLARAHGTLVLPSIEILIEAAYLLDQGLTIHPRRLLAVASSPDEKTLLENALLQAGIFHQEKTVNEIYNTQLACAPNKNSRQTISTPRDTTSPCVQPKTPVPTADDPTPYLKCPAPHQLEADVVVFEKKDLKNLATNKTVAHYDFIFTGPSALKRNNPKIKKSPPWNTFTPGSPLTKSTINSASLMAIWSLGTIHQPDSFNHADRPADIDAPQAIRMLDRWKSMLQEVQVKALLKCYGINSPHEEMVTSASAASLAGKEIGFPVAVKAVGPNLFQRHKLGALALDVPNQSSCRQAYHDVLFALSQYDPPFFLDGVLVSPMLPSKVALDCALLWPQDSPALMIVRLLKNGIYHTFTSVKACPLSKITAKHVAFEINNAILQFSAPERLDQLSDFFLRLSWVGPDLMGRMRWLWLDTVTLPTDAAPTQILDGRGEQTESLRAPLLYY